MIRLQIDPNEAKQLIQEATNGNWIPFGIVIGLLTLVVFLIVFILKMYRDRNDEKHSKTDEAIQKLTESNLNMDRLLLVHEKEIENIKREINL